MDGRILGIDQSTSGTKAVLFGADGGLLGRYDAPHRQIINDKGWVEHDPEEIFANLLKAVAGVIAAAGTDKREIVGVGISNQRETSIAWDRRTGRAVYNAIVWQCARGERICRRLAEQGLGEKVRRATGIPLSPYYSAAKVAWILENVSEARTLAASGRLCCSTIDSWLVHRLCGGIPATDYSNASRTQLFNISTLRWDADVCGWFGIDPAWLPEVRDSDSLFGHTDFGGILPAPVPVRGVMGDSHGALFGQGCLAPGSVKTTYGTGSSVMMNIGPTPVLSDRGIVTSLAWGIGGKVDYVLEGNINYTGAVIRWLVDDLKLLANSKEAGKLAREARDVPGLYIVPAFSGLGAPYWDGGARGVICGLTRAVGRAEIARAAEECIAYQIADIVKLMKEETGLPLKTLKVDGGATGDSFLMQFQADMIDAAVLVAPFEELSALGPAHLAGRALGLYGNPAPPGKPKARYLPAMPAGEREERYAGWQKAVGKALERGRNPL